ncbi:MAG: DUF1844 domain-containing protein [Phycisphaeraceae bacterium]|nr:DUF1844 domain-containing protein [Phycisphaeraceae bacterium]
MADQPTPQAPKIIVDSDWKAQAQAEKARLAAAEQEKASKAGTGPDARGVPGGPDSGRMPPADFQTLLGTMVTQALMYMGAFPDPETGRAVVSLEHSKFHIDLLEVLATKTKGNLTEQEDHDLTQTLSELRMRFVEISKAVAAAIAKQEAGGKIGGSPGGLKLT